MIFYFSGTGNSLYVARKLQENDGSELIDIADALNKKRFKYKVKDDEKIGFIFPVYFYGLPNLVSDFVDQLTIESNSKPFIYSVITCGASIGNADKMLDNILKQKNLQLDSSFSVVMPSNYVIMYNVPDKQKQKLTLFNAEKEIEEIIRLLEANKKGNFAHHGFISILTPIMYPIYGFYRKTKNFSATDACNSCGLCEKICPSEIIKLKSGKPEWIEGKCSHCSACINRCPTLAIQYGKSTMKRGRYVHPNVKFNP
ncbi:EFR1 family ferrodoxin [Methanobacterium sp. ACI-7]|uniref:EFR1 family ferrodoxin n=1 Tax=unclassified Methanobacterium TaxID=2627676 RepID=UPI0039C2E955